MVLKVYIVIDGGFIHFDDSLAVFLKVRTIIIHQVVHDFRFKGVLLICFFKESFFKVFFASFSILARGGLFLMGVRVPS